MKRLLLVVLLVASCRAYEPGLVRTEHDGVTCWHYGSTGYVSCQPDEPAALP